MTPIFDAGADLATREPRRPPARVGVASVLLSAALAAPHGAAATPGMAAREPPGAYARIAAAKRFHGVGTVTGIDAGSGVVTIDHKAIPGLMDAMEMDYNASPKSLLAAIRRGDRVEFEVEGKSYKILAIRKAGESP